MAETFVNFKKSVTSGNCYRKIKTYRVSWASNITYWVHNRSKKNSVIVRIISGPDRKSLPVDGADILVEPGEVQALVPNYFSKYSSLQYKSAATGRPAVLDIWFQMTRPPARGCFGVGNDWS